MKKVRNSNIELIRIISMLFIVVSHYTVHNGVDNTTLSLGINRFLLEITTLGNIGVILFVLISGYYLIDQKKFSLKKIVKLYLQVVFYSLGIYGLLIFLGHQEFSKSLLIKNIFPIIFEQYWFVTAYVSLYLLSPFINKFLNSLRREEHLIFNVISLILFSVIPTLTNHFMFGRELAQFIIFYSLGAYFKKYNNTILSNKKKAFYVFFVSLIVLLISVIVIDFIGESLPFISDNNVHLFNRYSIVSILFAVSLFNLFINKKEWSNNIINSVASCSFGVYLIHDNNMIREIIWSKIFNNQFYVDSNWLIIHMIVTVILVYLVCSLMEFVRINTVEKLTNILFNKNIDEIQNLIEKKVKKAIR